MHIVITSVRN